MAGKKGAKGGGGGDIVKKLDDIINNMKGIIDSLSETAEKIETSVNELVSKMNKLSENLATVSGLITRIKVVDDLVSNINEINKEMKSFSSSLDNASKKISEIEIEKLPSKKGKGKGDETKKGILPDIKYQYLDKFMVMLDRASSNIENMSNSVEKATKNITSFGEVLLLKPEAKTEVSPTSVALSPEILSKLNELTEILNKVNENLTNINNAFNNELLMTIRINKEVSPIAKSLLDALNKIDKLNKQVEDLKTENQRLRNVVEEQKKMNDLAKRLNYQSIKEMSKLSLRGAIFDILTSRFGGMLTANFVPLQTFLLNFGGLALGYLGRLYGQGGISKSILAKMFKVLMWNSATGEKTFTILSYMFVLLSKPLKLMSGLFNKLFKGGEKSREEKKSKGLLGNLLGGGKPPDKPPTGGGGEGGGGSDEKKNRNLIAGLKGALKGFGLLAIATGIAMIVDMFRRVASILMELEPIKATNQMMTTMLKLVFLPVAMMMMGILMPLIVAYLKMMQEVGWGNFVNLMFSVGKTIGDIFALITKVFGAKNIMSAIMGMILVITAPLIALTLIVAVIMTIITAIAGAFGLVADILGKVFGFLNTHIKIPSPNDIAKSFNSLFSGLSKDFSNIINGLSSALTSVWKGIVNTFTGIFNSILGAIGVASGWLGKIHSWFMSVLQGAVNDIKGFANTISGVVSQFWGWISGSVMAVWNTFVSAIQGIQNFLNSLPHFQSGGYVPATTVAVLHAGETVVPKGKAMVVGGGTNNIVINIHNEIHGAVDVDRMTDEIYQQLQVKLRRLRTW